MPYQIVVRQPGKKFRWRQVVEDILHYPRATAAGDGSKVELRTGTVIDISHSRQLKDDEADELHIRVTFKSDSDNASDAIFDVARLVGKKHGVQFWHEAFGLDYATATEKEILEAFDGEAPEEGGG